MTKLTSQINNENKSLTIKVEGNLTPEDIGELASIINKKEGNILQTIIIDIMETNSLSSSGMGALLIVRENFIDNIGGKVNFVIQANDQLKSYLKEAKFDDLFELQ